MNALNEDIRALAGSEYKYGFVTDLETDAVPRGTGLRGGVGIGRRGRSGAA